MKEDPLAGMNRTSMWVLVKRTSKVPKAGSLLLPDQTASPGTFGHSTT